MIELVCVFCYRDLEFQLLQAASIARYFERLALHRVIYVWHDSLEIPTGLRDLLSSHLDGICFELFSATELGIKPTFIGIDGWVTQQVAKLLAAQVVSTENYLVLDAKNHFVRPCSANDFVTIDGKGICNMEPLSSVEADAFMYCLQYFGINQQDKSFRVINNLTPFLLKKTLVERMLARLNQIDRREIAEVFFRHKDKLHEFFVYQAYLMSQGYKLSDYYEDTKTRITAVLWGNLMPGQQNFDIWIKQLENVDVKVSGVHWAACRNMSAEQRASVCDFWLDRGLVTSGREGTKIIESVVNRLLKGEEAFADKLLGK
jgi:hypothetical protein